MKGHAEVGAIQPGAWIHTPAVLPGSVLAGAGLVAAATVTGAWLARRHPGQREVWFAAAAGALLVIAGLHLLPDAWAGARTARIWPWLVPLTAVAALTAAGLATRAGCGCQERKQHASGAGTAAALAAHRFLEGSAIALAGSAAVAVALAVHAFGEGLAIGALLGAQPRQPGRRCRRRWCVARPGGRRAGAARPGRRGSRPSRPGEPARGLPWPGYQPDPAFSARRNHHHGRHRHRAGRARGRLSLDDHRRAWPLPC
jgi:hypothetical protein